MPTVNNNSWHIWAANFAMVITYYDRQTEKFVHIKNVKDVCISLDHETGLLEIAYKVGRCYFPVKLPITTKIAIGDVND